MRKFALELRDFWKQDFHIASYGATVLLLGFAMAVNYSCGWTERHLYDQPDTIFKLLRWMGFMALPYLAVVGLQAAFQGTASGLKKFGFWAMLAFAVIMIAITAWFPWHRNLSKMLVPTELMRWGVLVFWNLKRFAFMLLPMGLYWFWVDRRENRFYGLLTKPQGIAAYFALLLVVLPLVIWASFQPDFLKAYPQYFAGPAEARAGVSPWLTGAVFELVYGADFTLVELMFRGFLVVGMARWLGTRAVLPMAAMYCFLHFGKPMGEAIGSLVGGYILGVLALRSRSIWGGVIVHLGLAWMMEAAAYLQRV